MINVTKPFLPPIEEYKEILEGIWKRCWLTNHGPLSNALELELKEYLAIEHLLFVTNGTIALQLAIKALNLKGTIITTPFSYVATTSSIVWEGCSPIFVDIDKETLNIDPGLIEAAIQSDTTAIIATHVFGNPCHIEKIDKIAQKHQLKVIYDAAHCFGSKYNNQSVLNCGDISTISFHATKLFNTGEGGAVVTPKSETLKILSRLMNFGHSGPYTFDGFGINGKNSEFHAGLGLCNLKYIDQILAKRKSDYNYYLQLLTELDIKFIKSYPKSEINYSYFPAIFNNEEECLTVMNALEQERVYTRRYFYPSLSKLDYVKSKSTPISDNIASKILCLPMYYDLSQSEIKMICRIIHRTMRYKK